MSIIKITTWNINSIRARVENALDFLKSESPDVVLFQELKCENHQFPTEPFEELGYNLAIHGQKSYNSVGILSKLPIEDVQTSFPNDPDPSQARYIEGIIYVNSQAVKLACIYVPNGSDLNSSKFQYKMKFLESFSNYAKKELELDMKTIIGGDFNIAPSEIDIYDPEELNETICFSHQERSIFRKLLNYGYSESYRSLHPNKQEFSWWSYMKGSWQKNNGMRIDHFLLSPEAHDCLTSCKIDMDFRAKDKPSDHASVTIEMDI